MGSRTNSIDNFWDTPMLFARRDIEEDEKTEIDEEEGAAEKAYRVDKSDLILSNIFNFVEHNYDKNNNSKDSSSALKRDKPANDSNEVILNNRSDQPLLSQASSCNLPNIAISETLKADNIFSDIEYPNKQIKITQIDDRDFDTGLLMSFNQSNLAKSKPCCSKISDQLPLLKKELLQVNSVDPSSVSNQKKIMTNSRKNTGRNSRKPATGGVSQKRAGGVYFEELFYTILKPKNSEHNNRMIDNFVSSNKMQVSIFCPRCSIYIDLSILAHHMMHHLITEFDISEGNFYYNRCNHCLHNFPTKELLENHQQLLYSGNSNACKICLQPFENFLRFRDHMKSMHVRNEMPYRCPDCFFRSSVATDLHIHIYTEHSEAYCPFCLKSFNLFRTALVDSDTDQETRDKQLKIKLKHMLVHLQHHLARLDYFGCQKCSLVFLTKRELFHHSIYAHQSEINLNNKKYTLKYHELSSTEKTVLHSYRSVAEVEQAFDMNLSRNYNCNYGQSGAISYVGTSTRPRRDDQYLQSNPLQSNICSTDNSGDSPLPSTSRGLVNNRMLQSLQTYQPPTAEEIEMVQNLLSQNTIHSEPKSRKKTTVFKKTDYLLAVEKVIATAKSRPLMQQILMPPELIKKFSNALKLNSMSQDIEIKKSRSTVLENIMNTYLKLDLIDQFKMKCNDCNEFIVDRFHYQWSPVPCHFPQCYYGSTCDKAVQTHVQNKLQSWNRGRNHRRVIIDPGINNLKLGPLSKRLIAKSKVEDPEYDYQEEIRMIQSKFSSSQSPFHINMCRVCGRYFDTFQSASIHLLANPSHTLFRKNMVYIYRLKEEEEEESENDLEEIVDVEVVDINNDQTTVKKPIRQTQIEMVLD